MCPGKAGAGMCIFAFLQALGPVAGLHLAEEFSFYVGKAVQNLLLLKCFAQGFEFYNIFNDVCSLEQYLQYVHFSFTPSSCNCPKMALHNIAHLAWKRAVQTYCIWVVIIILMQVQRGDLKTDNVSKICKILPCPFKVFVLIDVSLFPDHGKSPSELTHRRNMEYKQGVSRVCRVPIYPALTLKRVGICIPQTPQHFGCV